MLINILEEHRDIYAAEVAAGFGPKRPGDAGIDLRAAQTKRISTGQTEVVNLGVRIEIPKHTVGRVVGRSTTLLSYSCLTHEGIIDSGYRGEIHMLLTALDRAVTIERGERICQLIVTAIMPPDGHTQFDQLMFAAAKYGWQLADELSETSRGHRGLGSTGRE